MKVTKERKISFREIRLAFFIMCTTLILLVPSLYVNVLENYSFGFLITNALIGLLSFFMIIKETRKKAYSLHLIHWIFQYLFFFIAPLIQYLNNDFPWSFLFSSDSGLLIWMNILIIFWQFSWLLTQFPFVKRFVKSNEVSQKEYTYYIGKKKILILFMLSLLVLACFIYLYGIGGLFTRGASTVNEIQNSSLLIMFKYSGRAIPVLLLVLLLLRARSLNTTGNKIMITMAAILVLLTNFPGATPRFWMAGVYLGLFLFIFKIKSKNLLVYVLFFGLNVIFPLFGSIRSAKSLGDIIKTLDLNRILSANFLVADYDAYAMIGYTWRYIENLGVTYGNQLMTAVFFFIPRSIWEEKSVGSGKIVASELNFAFDNVSSPLPAEALINFGLFGIFIFAILISILCLKLDYLFWEENSSIFAVFYPFLIGFFFFIMRGDMLSSISFTVGFAMSFILFRPKKIEC